LIELMVAVAIIGILASLSIPNYLKYVDKARVARAIAEMRGIAIELDELARDGVSLPDSLAELGITRTLDPWGLDYYYLRIQGQLPPGMSQTRSPLPLVSAPPDDSGGGGGNSNSGNEGGGGDNVIGSARKDRFMVPINSDYDLYSAGPDGETRAPLQVPVSRDDVIRAGDGSYYGIAEKF
jgi:general secretion pathway protein G